MFCQNCNKEIGTQKECGFCGYNHELDNGTAQKNFTNQTVNLPKTTIKLLKKRNSMASSGLVMSIFSFIPLPFMLLAFIFNIKATFRCKPYRSGVVKCVIAWIFFLFWVLLYSVIISSLLGNS